MPPRLHGFALCRRCEYEEPCRPFREELEGAVANICKLEIASGRRFGAFDVIVNTEICLAARRRRLADLDGDPA